MAIIMLVMVMHPRSVASTSSGYDSEKILSY